MSPRTRSGLVAVAAIASLATAAGACEALLGFPRRIDGHWVRRATTWYGYDLALPIP